MRHAWSQFWMKRLFSGSLLALVGVVVLAAVWYTAPGTSATPAAQVGDHVQPHSTAVAEKTAAETNLIEFPVESWQAAGITVQPVVQAPFPRVVELTGKIALNEDRVAHIYPLVDGRVEEVNIHLGDKVKKGELLVVVQSTDVGKGMLTLFQDRLQRDFSQTKDRWTQTVAANTQAMIKLIRAGESIEEIEKQLTDRPMGEYRDKLITAYVAYGKARKSLDRLAPLSSGGAITGKHLLEAESEWSAARATLQSLLEQFQQETQQAAILSAQAVKELETRVAVDETNLKILGFDDSALTSIDPLRQGEAISHYPIVSPFDGTIVSKDVVLLERVGPQSQILSIADLSTVWVTTDIYEEHLPLLTQLENQTIHLRSPAWPGKTFAAKIFYTGDLLQESSRTVAMRALAENRDGQLRPGMFVNVELPLLTGPAVAQVPLAAVQEHAGKSFVFVQVNAGNFVRREVTVGLRNAEAAQIVAGLQVNEQVVVTGGFALKSRMLAELLSE